MTHKRNECQQRDKTECMSCWWWRRLRCWVDSRFVEWNHRANYNLWSACGVGWCCSCCCCWSFCGAHWNCCWLNRCQTARIRSSQPPLHLCILFNWYTTQVIFKSSRHFSYFSIKLYLFCHEFNNWICQEHKCLVDDVLVDCSSCC